MAASGGPGPQAIIALDIRLWLTAQSECLWCVDVRPTDRLSVDQAVQKVQHVGFGCDALSQGHFHGDQHGLFIMLQACLRHDVMEDQRQDIDHLAITARLVQHEILQLLEGRKELRKGGTVPQGAGLALKDGQVISPIVDRPWWELMIALDHSHMLAQDLSFGSDHQTF